MFAIEASGITKDYGSTRALDDFSLKVAPGTVFALLGPNGAGKTTFVKIMLGLTRADSGSLTIGGLDHRRKQSRQKLAYLPERFNFFPYYTVEAVLDFYAALHGHQAAADETANVLERLEIDRLRDQRIKTLSKGQLQRLGAAAMVLSRAETLIFDEPFSGLDPLGIRDLKLLFAELKAAGRTVFLNSHLLSEVEQVADTVAIINRGRLLAEGPLRELTENEGLEDFFYHTIKG
ncbi:MAG: Lipopolysaccharide export system ATP-binding protein LptB [Deltaproteobacteria bacterium ADurb.Bin510]|nr:MAG: Lipopolysaccharide export system ATP-binding protein LptB [Deltaproteobacteria bacterium ADurb.Bin510]